MEENIFCQNVKALRLAEGISKEEMAKFLRISTRTLTQIENGVIPRRTSTMVLIRLADRYGIMMSELFRPLDPLPQRITTPFPEVQKP